MYVRDVRGYVDNVTLHQGTIINPTGLTLAPGMVVSILGYNAGPFFAANEVDTPYTYTYGVPYYAGSRVVTYRTDLFKSAGIKALPNSIAAFTAG